MSRTEPALKPLVANSSSAAHRIASRKFGLRVAAAFLLTGPRSIICTIVQKIWSSQQGDFQTGLAQLISSLPGIAVRRTASLPLAYDPAIHPLRMSFLRRLMDARIPATPTLRRGCHMVARERVLESV